MPTDNPFVSVPERSKYALLKQSLTPPDVTCPADLPSIETVTVVALPQTIGCGDEVTSMRHEAGCPCVISPGG
ncbi:MAG: hypothetical protein WBZ42_10780 [Halobacteriota archaeon]